MQLDDKNEWSDGFSLCSKKDQMMLIYTGLGSSPL